MVSAPSGIHSRRAAPGPKGQKVPPCLRGLLVRGPPPDHLDSPTAPPLVNRMEFDKGGVTATDLRDIWARFAGCDRQATVVAGFLGPAPTVVEDQGRRSPQPCVGFGRHRRYEGPTPNTRRSSRRYSAQSASRSTRRTIARCDTSSSAGTAHHPNSSAGPDHASELGWPPEPDRQHLCELAPRLTTRLIAPWAFPFADPLRNDVDHGGTGHEIEPSTLRLPFRLRDELPGATCPSKAGMSLSSSSIPYSSFP